MFTESDLSTWTEADYDRALVEIETLMNFDRGTPENARLEIIGTLVEGYEAIHWHIPAPSADAKERYSYGADKLVEEARLVSAT